MLRVLTPIGHCSVRLRRLLEIEEEQALKWRIRIRRRNRETEDREKKSGGRWFVEPNFGVPGPFWDRPISPLGHVSFHFAWTVVSRSPTGKSIVTDSRGRERETDRSPADYDKYIGREGAVMTIGPADFDRYAAQANVTDLALGKTVALLSNISDCALEREEFWNAVHVCARKTGPDRLILECDRGTKKEWRAIAAAENVPADIRRAAAELASGTRRKAEFPMTEAEGKATIELICRSVPGANRKKGPVRYSLGRNPRTQYRMEVELPDGIDNAARIRIMHRMADKIRETGAMYTITIHEPDEHNDSRNYHLHIVAYDRPAKLINGQWDFTIREVVKGQRGRKNWSERKRKVVVPSLVTDSNRGDFSAFLKSLRSEYAEICNEELRKAGSERLFDPRRYKQMGIDREPTKPLGTRLAPLEAVGVPTKVGCHNAEVIWTYELQARLKRCEADRIARQEKIAGLRATVERSASASQRQQAAAALERCIQDAAFLDLAEPELAEYEVTLAMARARPAKAVDTCSRILDELDAGRGSLSDRSRRNLIEARLAEAKSFLSEIERIDKANQRVIADQQPLIDEARAQFAAAVHDDVAVKSTPEASPQLDTVLTTEVLPNETVKGPVAAASPEPKDISPSAQVSEPTPVSAEETVPEPCRELTLDDVIARIIEDRLPVLGPDYHDGQDYRVGRIARDELRVLREPANYGRAQAELARVAVRQLDDIKRAHLFFRSHSQARAGESATDSASRLALADRQLAVLLAYKDHPDAARRMGWDKPEEGQQEAADERQGTRRPSIWRRMRVSLATAFPRSEIATEQATVDAASGVEAQPPQVIPTGPSVADAVAEYADAIRTDPAVRLITVDGELRVDPSSMPEWQRSVAAFEDQDVVHAAIRDRWAEVQKEKEEIAQLIETGERFRTNMRAKILAALERGELFPRRTTNGWMVDGKDEDVVHWANQWCDHPQLTAGFEETLRRAKTAPVHSAAPQPRQAQTRGQRGSSAAISATQGRSTSPQSTPDDDLTLAQQQAILRGRSRMGGK